ncbi:MAG: hypothetical protein ACT4TC_24390 [Myxococcaceae bacterium]
MNAQPSVLIQAAEGLDQSLTKFQQLVESVEKAPLTSQKGIERAAKLLQEIVDLEGNLETRIRDLVNAVTTLRERQEGHARAAHTRALELQSRTATFQELLERYGTLGRAATDLNAQLQGVEQKRAAAASGEADIETATAIGPLLDRMGQVAAEAGTLADDAGAKDFDDVARQADSLRQQLLSAKNKLDLLHKKLARA